MEIMTSPEKYFENVLRPDLADLYRRNKEQYIFNAKEWTRLYADDPGTAESWCNSFVTKLRVIVMA